MPEVKEEVNIFKLINKKPIIASEREIKQNLPSRSAKLRCAIKLRNSDEVETDILDKFKYLLDIENYSKKL
jgi:16S rRNA (cytosine1402-N4)-methyltransferase